MRIGIFHPTLDMYGGAEVVGVIIANTLVNNGYKVNLFVNKPINQGKIVEMIGEPLLPSIKIIKNSNILPPRGKFHLYESAIRSLIFKSKCDVILDTYSCCVFPWIDISYIHFPYLNNYEFKQRFPYLKTPHLQNVLTLPYAILEKNLENYDTKLLLANSFFTAKAIKDSLGVDSKVLYPPVPSAIFQKNLENSKNARENIVVTLARFGPGKGVEIVPQIASLTNKSLRFILIGLAHDQSVVQSVKESVKKLGLKDRVELITDASRQDIKATLAKAKIYLHTTKMEHFGISIAEAMAMGCLPVVHDSGGAPEFVPDKYRYKTLDEAAGIIERAVEEWTPQSGKRMTELVERFSEKNFSKRFVELFTNYCESLEGRNSTKKNASY